MEVLLADGQVFPAPGKRWYGEIKFYINGYRGIHLPAALRGDFHGMDDPESEVMFATGPKVTYKVQWPGEQPHKVPKSARYTSSSQGRAKIAYQVAEIMYDYIEKQGGILLLGTRVVTFDEIYLIEVRRVSKGTWVPIFAVA